MVWFILGAIFIILVLLGFRLVYEYQRLVRFRLGKYKDVIKPGLRWIIPFIDTVEKVDLRTFAVDVQPQECMTEDNVPVHVDAVVYYHVKEPEKSVLNIENYTEAVILFARAALRDSIGKESLDTVLSNREKIAGEIKSILDKGTDPWGVDVQEVKIQQVELPESMKRAMAAQAEAEREKRATIIKSEGEVKSAENLRKAGETLAKSPASIHLRTLATISDIASDPSQKFIIPLPLEFLQSMNKKKK
ncbi:slipin family protein [Candidatus Woesearchaeota archaeon]|nr:slipin family protein [Candidatus Woesearchaeota archaeon]